MRLPTEIFGPDQLLADRLERLAYETDAGPDRAVPDGVVLVESARDVERLVAWAGERGLPLIARGAGTGLAGGAVADRGGLVVVLARLDRIGEIDPLARTVEAEAGVVNLELQRAVASRDLYYPPDPASGRSSLIGGNLATNAGGPHCFKYGVTTNYVRQIEAVLASGERVDLGSRASDAPGYDLVGLVVGSEGTLAIVTRACLELLRRPPAVRTLMVAFESLEVAGEAVSAIIAAGLVPATLEAIDQPAMRMIEEFCDAGLPVASGAVLIIELDGYEEGLAGQTEEVVETVRRHGATDIRIADDEEERRRIWYGRKSAAGAMSRLAPSYYLTDITVRRSRLAAVLGEINRICEAHELPTASFFHAGDGNLHPLLPCDPRDRVVMARVEKALEEIVSVCLAEDGSISGEHGIGSEKRAQMTLMHAGAELTAMLEIKQAFDPAGLLNPGKVLPSEVGPVIRQPAAPPEGEVFEPTTAEEAAAGLRGLSEAGRKVRIGGAWTGPSDGVRLVTSSLTGIVEFAPQDLFVTVGAGTPIAELEELAHEHGLIVPLAAPWNDTTAGGLVAANLNAPLKSRYGSVRDCTLAMRVAMTDGRVLRAGRPLVKNVAGYDLPKAFVGSHGTLGLLTEITFKLAPAPRELRTLAIPVESLDLGVELAHTVLPAAIAASGVVLSPLVGTDPHGGEGWLLQYTAEGLEEEVTVELERVERAWAGLGNESPRELGRSATRVWADHLAWAGDDDLVVRAAVPPSELATYLQQLAPRRLGRLVVDCGAGTVYAILGSAQGGNDPNAAQTWLEGLRKPALELAGYALTMQRPPALRAAIDPWGFRPGGLEVMRRLKDLWDPAGILGRGPVG